MSCQCASASGGDGPRGGTRCASSRPAIPSCKRHSGVLEQENPADLSLDVTGDPEAFLVAADEECRDRLVDDARIQRLKLCGDGCKPIRREDAGAVAVLPDRSARAWRKIPFMQVEPIDQAVLSVWQHLLDLDSGVIRIDRPANRAQ